MLRKIAIVAALLLVAGPFALHLSLEDAREPKAHDYETRLIVVSDNLMTGPLCAMIST